MTKTDELSESKKLELDRKEELLSKIAELGGKGMKEEDIVFEGTRLALPERFRGDLGSAIDYLEKKRDEEEEESSFSRTYNYRPWDGAFNAFHAMKKAFGMVAGKTTYSFFGKNPPQYLQIASGVDQTEEVPWGKFIVPLLDSTVFNFGATSTPDFGQVFKLNVTSPRKNRFIIEGLFKLVDEELKVNSLYRGKVIDGQTQPQFIDLSGFDPEKVIYSEQALADLEASVWSVLRYSQAHRELGLPLKRAILLSGPYGTGKSLAGLRTAVEADAAGWTFIMARPGKDDFLEVMQTARLYQPAVVFMEDADTMASAENEDLISQILDVFDGIQSKNTDLMVVMTTNHPEALHKGMMRPGRLDAIIEIGALDDLGIEKLIRTIIPAGRLAEKIDFGQVCQAATGYMPAFVKELGDRAVRYALSRNNGDLGAQVITTEDLVHAANGLRSQFERMQEAPEYSTNETLGTTLSAIIETATRKSVAELAPEADNTDESFWDVNQLALAQKNGR